MKLRCNVKVRNRMLDGELKKRSQRSQLLIGKEPGDSGLYIILQTLDNVNGSKYKVKCIYFFHVGIHYLSHTLDLWASVN